MFRSKLPIDVLACGLLTLTLACGDGDDKPERVDAGFDAGAREDGGLDARPGETDAGESAADTGSDGAARDAAAEAAAPDANTSEAGADAGCTPFVMPAGCVIPEDSALPSELRCTGLYARFEERVLACDVIHYAPAYELWSDGAVKERWVWLPRGAKLDASNPNEIVFPVGTKFWKEFRTADGARLLETRLLQKAETGWLYTSYVWTQDATNAVQENDGVENLLGTGHVVPTRDQCNECHRGRAVDKILGWDAFMLGAGAKGLTRDELVRRGLFEAGKELPSLSVPGDAIEKAALGYLHANCGVSCHNTTLGSKAGDTGFLMRLEADVPPSSASATPLVKTGLHKVPGTNSKYGGISVPDGGAPRDYFRDLVPRDTARSLTLVRMASRGGDGEMPSIGTKKVDDAGVATVRAWIERMSPDAGYPDRPDGG